MKHPFVTRPGRHVGMLASCAATFTAVLLGSAAAQNVPKPESIKAEIAAALERISANSLRGHLSFLASDLLEGRETPSRGLDLAALYIAAQFRRAGLEPLGDDGYFQTAEWTVEEPNDAGFSTVFHFGDEGVPLSTGQMSLRYAYAALKLERVPVVKLAYSARPEPKLTSTESLKDKVVLLEETSDPGSTAISSGQAAAARARIRRQVLEQQAALLVILDRTAGRGMGLAPSRRASPSRPGGSNRGASRLLTRTPELMVHDPKLIERLAALPAGNTTLALTLQLAPPERIPAKVRNVIGLLRGSDPKLKDTYVLVTAHYDHLGQRPSEESDKIYNGANDDGSGTVSVIELSSALSTLKPRPKRSIVFITFFGEEHGMLGSRFYADHPVVPLASTVAGLNFEQVGRTDSTEGAQIAVGSMTGFDYSTMGKTLQRAGERVGVRIVKHASNSDRYFGASDNAVFAQRGIPAHTLCVAFQYPDYHQVGDHWQKIDFANMALIDRAAALGVIAIADDPERPRWNEENPRAKRYAQAAKEG